MYINCENSMIWFDSSTQFKRQWHYFYVEWRSDKQIPQIKILTH